MSAEPAPRGRGTPVDETPRPGSGAMFDRIAARYDLLNRVMSLGLDRSWRRRAIDALDPKPGARLLDVATGTADMALLAMARAPGVTVDGLDPSPEMLSVARQKADRAGLGDRLRLVAGDAERLAWEDDAFDGSMIAFGIRNVPDRARALVEMNRVTRPGAPVVVLELNEPRRGPVAALSRAWVRHVVPRVGAAISGRDEYRYLQESIEAFPAPDVFSAAMAAAGIDAVRVRTLGLGACSLFVGRAT